MPNIKNPSGLSRIYESYIVDGWFPADFMENLNTLTLTLIASAVEEGDICIDAGANLGRIAFALKTAVGKVGNVICIEPNPQLAEELRKNDLYVIEAALVDFPVDDLEFYQHVNPDHWDLGSVVPDYLKNFFPQLEQTVEIHKVQGVTLSKVLRMCHHVKFLKIDIEGLDEQVLLNTYNLNEKVEIIEWEHNYDVSKGIGQLLYNHLTSMGYKVYDCFFNEISEETAINPKIAPINRYAVLATSPKISVLRNKVADFWSIAQKSPKT